MIPEIIITQYGYLAIFLGTLVEGEVVLILAGYLAQKGLLSLFWVIFLGSLATVLIDEILFFLGYFKGQKVLLKISKEKIERIEKLIRKYETFFIFIYRFVYGTRTLSPIVIGASHVKILKFIFLNIINTVIWVILLVLGGYFFGQTFSKIIGKFELELLLLIIISGSILFIFRKRIARL